MVYIRFGNPSFFLLWALGVTPGARGVGPDPYLVFSWGHIILVSSILYVYYFYFSKSMYVVYNGFGDAIFLKGFKWGLWSPTLLTVSSWGHIILVSSILYVYYFYF